ncbi:Suppressor of fused protein (SUFU) [Enterobacterales bacterium CwR94]|nr:Suppressor of fused protein (SUFU) [Enterobacterales bacterium CwR94]
MSLTLPVAEVFNQQQTLKATVEQDARTAYFYLWPTEPLRGQFPVRGCWLRNLSPAPSEPDEEAYQQGIPPLLSAEFCRTLEPEPMIDPAGVTIVWEPGDEGAALWYHGQLLAVIPGWSLYQDQQVSFSASCIKPNPLTAPLGSASTNKHYALAEQHRQFWRDWTEGQRWGALQRDMISCYERHYGNALNYYTIDQGRWPPMAISQHLHQGVWYFLTLGMSIRPMPAVDYRLPEEAPRLRRAEVAMAIDAQIMTQENALRMATALAEFAHFPWQHFDWLQEGSVLTSELCPVGFEGFALSHELADDKGQIVLPKVEGDRLQLLWSTPITANELHYAATHSEGGKTVIGRLRAQGCSHIFRPRQDVCDADEF